MEASAIRMLMISGSLRSGSTNSALLATARAVAPAHVSAVLYDGLARLSHFNPDDDVDGRPPETAVAELRAQIGAADAVLFSTPEYAGGLPGSFKNLLDWTVGGGETYGKPVAWINASGPAAPTGAADAHASLRKVLAYTGADVVESACVRIPVLRAQIGADGLIEDATIRERLAGVLGEIARHVEERRAAP